MKKEELLLIKKILDFWLAFSLFHKKIIEKRILRCFCSDLSNNMWFILVKNELFLLAHD